MHSYISIGSFGDELEKIAHWSEHAAEIGGLGVLAAPTVAKMVGKPMSDKWKDRSELAGLGILAGPSVKHLIKGATVDLSKVASFLKAGQAGGVLRSMMANPMNKAHALSDAAKSAPAAITKVAPRAMPKPPSSFQNITPSGGSSGLELATPFRGRR